jgi:transcriptional regulator with XRE-family HTH domain
MTIDKATLGTAIKKVRSARGLTQAELAKAAGLSEGGKSVALIEQGRRSVSVDSLNSIANALNVPSACLTILGSQSIGKNKAATDFMKSLQDLILKVIVAEQQLAAEAKGERAKREMVSSEQKRLSEVAALFRTYEPSGSQEFV